MVWKEPEPHEIQVHPETLAIIKKSIYYNSEGVLSNSSFLLKFEYAIGASLVWFILTSIIYFLLSLMLSNTILNITAILFSIFSIVVLTYVYYKFGFKYYREAWYLFDEKDEILTVVRQNKTKEWEIIELPYEDIHEIEWYDGPNGKAIVKAAGFEFATNRAKDKRASSVTELWQNLAKINTRMRSWPYNLECPQCGKVFGNHTGTAICPFDDFILLDPKVKGRIDPIRQHPEDLDRV